MLGMRGTGDWATSQRPENWREMILYLYPNGSAPLTAMMSKMKQESVNDPVFNWWTKLLPSQGGAVSGVYTDASMDTAYVSTGLVTNTLYIKVAAAVIAHFRIGHQVLLRDASDFNVDCTAKVTGVQTNGASSRITVELLEDDDNSSDGDLSDCDTILVIGNLNPEGSSRPTALAYDPTLWTNYTQIFRTPLEITRTARKTHLRTGDAYKEAKRECLELHSIEMEKAFLFGQLRSGTGINGKPERTMRGLINALKYGSNGTLNVGVTSNYVSDSSWAGQTWEQGGEEWLDTHLEEMFRYGRGTKLAFAGSGALLGINRLAKAAGQIQLKSTTIAYGLQVVEWITPFGTIYVKTHPLFSFEATNRNSMLIFEPEDLRYRYIDDTMFRKAPPDSEAQVSIDGTVEEYLTECGLEYHHPNGWGWLNGFNSTNTAS
uniref:Putative capsid protein n=1 Tax=viral metagenome TaxID=1070528 RepID=A0A6M3K1S8_9ZZZZ